MNDEDVDQDSSSTTDVLLEAVSRVLEIGGNTEARPVDAMLVYSYLDPSGRELGEYVITIGMSIEQTIGRARMVQVMAENDFLESLRGGSGSDDEDD
jgi:hypothetical protein